MCGSSGESGLRLGPAVDGDMDAAARVLGLALSGHDSADRLRRAAKALAGGAGFVAQVGEDVVGAACVTSNAKGYELALIAVEEHWRGRGVGRQLLTHIVDVLGVDELYAETDRDSVGFYRAMGWTISSLGEKYPGVERFDCRWRAPAA